jgi:hypothetical protein
LNEHCKAALLGSGCGLAGNAFEHSAEIGHEARKIGVGAAPA